ncbi:hypothetical protein [Streptosporangium sp. NPDC001681]|uniref:hypothetical protein n=1 Tax=Streptosporangium sp. NPDC001681 TaxID=3154395 RepID=UPI00331CA558
MTPGSPFAERRFVRFKQDDRIMLDEPLPANTLDPRYDACSEHRTACDCREAMFAENVSEQRAEWEHAKRMFNEVLEGHPTYAYDKHGKPDEQAQCKCSGCVIARRLRLRTIGDVVRDREAWRRRDEPPF